MTTLPGSALFQVSVLVHNAFTPGKRGFLQSLEIFQQWVTMVLHLHSRHAAHYDRHVPAPTHAWIIQADWCVTDSNYGRKDVFIYATPRAI